MTLSAYQAARKPHRFLVEVQDPECQEAYDTAIAAGRDPQEAQCCYPMCYRVTKVECPYGPDEEHVDCALWQECSCVCPDDDPQYEDAAYFTYKFDTTKPVGDPDRYVRVWADGSTAEGIALELAYELAMEEFEEKHTCGNWERTEPQQCWVQYCFDGVDEALDWALGGLTPGWHAAYVENEGSIDESILTLDLVVPESGEGCEV